ncbi:MAG: penicillin-binding protein 2 [Pseudomonadota bacterium]|nr:penicillin-binding protein 2 [Pseudomonadota bacterium]
MTTPIANARSQARKLDGARKQALETGRNRLLVTAVVLNLAFAAVIARVVDLTVMTNGSEPRVARTVKLADPPTERADVVDRNGVILATSLPTVSLYADPGNILNVDDAADRLVRALPQLNRTETIVKLNSQTRFVWLKRDLTPSQHYEINRFGIPGIAFQRGERRVYPQGRLAGHVLGLTDVDGRGVSGIERYFDQTLRAGGGPLRLALDLRVQAVLHEELTASMKEFKALGAAGVILDVDTGEIVAMVSLPDFDPNARNDIEGEAGFNNVTKGVYEIGSIFKLFTVAMALDTGTVDLSSGYDASEPIHVSRFTISDYHAKNRWLSVPEIILHSSNIGAAKMAVDVGTEMQRTYLERFGMISPALVELPEVGVPLTPSKWRPVNTMTISYGYGIAVSPLQLADGIAALVNGGIRRPTTILLSTDEPAVGERVVSAETSRQVRSLMRLVVSRGTGRKADVPGYLIGGKTGTADKQSGRGYAMDAKISSFVGAYPINDPLYVVLALFDEPVGIKRTSNYATGGWVAAPAVGRIVRRMAPIVGIAPDLYGDIELPRVALPKQAEASAPSHRAAGFDSGAAKTTAVVWQVSPGTQTSNNERVVLRVLQAPSGVLAANGN